MQAVILIGIQGAGKSTFYERHFASTHLRISMDVAMTRAREERLLQSCIETRRDFVVDNTNPTPAHRSRFIVPAKNAGFRITGHFFVPDVKASLERNARRSGKARIPVPGIYRTAKILKPPSYAEGFDELFEVRLVNEEFSSTPLLEEAPGPSEPGTIVCTALPPASREADQS